MPDIPEMPKWWNTRFDPYLLEVGRISKMWASTEHAIDRMIWFLMNVPPKIGACATAQMIGPGPRMGTLLSLAAVRHVHKTLIEELQRFDKEAASLGARRNRYSHDAIYEIVETEEIRTIEITADRKLRFEQQGIDIGKARKLWMEIRDLNLQLANFHNRLLTKNLWPIEPPDVRPYSSQPTHGTGQDLDV